MALAGEIEVNAVVQSAFECGIMKRELAAPGRAGLFVQHDPPTFARKPQGRGKARHAGADNVHSHAWPAFRFSAHGAASSGILETIVTNVSRFRALLQRLAEGGEACHGLHLTCCRRQ
jgi:hypothetical protein